MHRGNPDGLRRRAPDSDARVPKVTGAAAFFRSTDPALFSQHTTALPAHTEDSASGPYAPDLEFFPTPFGYLESGEGLLPNTEMFGLHMVLLRWAGMPHQPTWYGTW